MKVPNTVGKFLRNQFTHQNNEGRSIDQNHNKHNHIELTWKLEVGKTTERDDRGEFHYNNGDYRWASLVC